MQKVRVGDGRKEKTSFCIVDAQSVKNTDTAEEKGYDAGKKVSGNEQPRSKLRGIKCIMLFQMRSELRGI